MQLYCRISLHWIPRTYLDKREFSTVIWGPRSGVV